MFLECTAVKAISQPVKIHKVSIHLKVSQHPYNYNLTKSVPDPLTEHNAPLSTAIH